MPGGVRLSDLPDDVLRKLPFRSHISNLRYKRFMKVEQHPNGGAWILRASVHEFAHLNPHDQLKFAHEFFKALKKIILKYFLRFKNKITNINSIFTYIITGLLLRRF